MSEKIKVTIVIDDEKQNREIDGSLGKNRILTHDTSMTLMSTLLQNNLMEGSFCGGRGDCGRARHCPRNWREAAWKRRN